MIPPERAAGQRGGCCLHHQGPPEAAGLACVPSWQTFPRGASGFVPDGRAWPCCVSLEGHPRGRGLPPAVRGAGQARTASLTARAQAAVTRHPAAALECGNGPLFLPLPRIRRTRRQKAHGAPTVVGGLLLLRQGRAQTPASQELRGRRVL